MNEYLILFLFFIIALFYASIGFGGGSSYLAILSLLLTDFHEIRTLALLLNIVVVSIGTYHFVRNKIFDWNAFWPFVALSVPFAFLGARLRLSQEAFFLALGFALILAAILMLLQSVANSNERRNLSTAHRSIIGGSIGFLSGLVGIGGGIFLSPTLNLMGWRSAKTIASLSSAFILVNSIAGVSGLLVAGTFKWNQSYSYLVVLAVLIGGFIGSRASINLPIRWIRILTAILVLYVGTRITLQYSFGIKI